MPILAFLLGWGICVFVVGKPVIVAGTSMYPTLKNGDRVLQIDCLPWSPLTRGDVVVLNDGQCRAVKRIIGLPGENIRLSGGHVLVNNFVLYEPYLSPHTVTSPAKKGSEFTLSKNQYFVMGDNRTNSLDSRDYGPISFSHIVGEVDVDHHQPIRYLMQPVALVHAEERSETHPNSSRPAPERR